MNVGIYEWIKRFRREGLTPSTKIALRDLLAPRVILNEPLRRREDEKTPTSVAQINDLVSWEIVLNADQVHYFLKQLNQIDKWRESLPLFLPDATSLLQEALDLMRELEGATDKSDLSYIAQPSISPHSQNRDYRDWTALIDLTRDAWLATATVSPQRARLEVERWLNISYPLFRRLVFFAAAESQLFTAAESLNWLLLDDKYWLWSTESEREALRLLVAIGPKLDVEQQQLLCGAVLEGPHRDMFRANIEPKTFERISNREIWLRLSKLRASGSTLPKNASDKLKSLSVEYPAWQLEGDESDEFPVWTGDVGGRQIVQTTPTKRRDLEAWLQKNPASDFWQDDDWLERCRVDFPRAALALLHLAKRGEWPSDRWRTALQVWSEETRVSRSWRYFHTALLEAPENVLFDLAHSIGWFLQNLGKTIDRYESDFFALITKLLAGQKNENIEPDSDLMFKSLNHPVGLVTQGCFLWWYRQKLQDDHGLDAALKQIFTQIADVRVEIFRYGRVLLGSNLIALFRVDRKWTEEKLLPLFDWKNLEDEAHALWMGFLWSPRLYPPLVDVFKSDLIATAAHYQSLGECGRQYVAFVTFAGLEQTSSITRKDVAQILSFLPSEGLAHSAHTLVEALEGVGDKRVEYWNNRIHPFIQYVWPKSSEALSPNIVKSFARLCVSAGDAFPDAFAMLKRWLRPLSDPDTIILGIHQTKLSERFPTETLEFLDMIVGQTIFLVMAKELVDCLETIRRAQPDLATDARFRRLETLVRQRGGI